MNQPKRHFLYVMDPMCSWCYAFRSGLNELLMEHELPVQWVMGGLATDSDQPMPESMSETIAGYWKRIEQQTGTPFNHDFWAKNTPRRSTYPACRAVVAVQQMTVNKVKAMVEAIQNAYYLNAQNPSNNETLIQCAEQIGLDRDRFTELLSADSTEQLFQQNLQIAQQLQVQGFPSLFLVDEQHRAIPVAMGYLSYPQLVSNVEAALQRSY